MTANTDSKYSTVEVSFISDRTVSKFTDVHDAHFETDGVFTVVPEPGVIYQYPLNDVARVLTKRR